MWIWIPTKKKKELSDHGQAITFEMSHRVGFFPTKENMRQKAKKYVICPFVLKLNKKIKAKVLV